MANKIKKLKRTSSHRKKNKQKADLYCAPSFSRILQQALALHQTGRLSEAEILYRQILSAEPNHPEALHFLGLLAHQAGRSGTGAELISRALLLKPDDAEAHNNLGLALKGQGRLDEAVASYRQALALRPEFAAAHYNLGNTLHDQGRLDEAAACYRRALSLDQDLVDAHYNLALILQDQGKLEEAAVSYLLALGAEPDLVEVHNNLGVVYSRLGRMDEAIACYRKALSLKPDSAGTYKNLSTLVKFTEVNDEVRAMEACFRQTDGISETDRIELGFALGKVFEDLRDYDKSFAFILEANRLKRRSYDYSIQDDLDLFARIKATFSPDFFASHQGSGNQDKTPIFVLGMPRSGTTLVEQILASHPVVFGAGELTHLNSLVSGYCQPGTEGQFPECMLDLGTAALERMGKEYVEKIRVYSPDAERITDKMPDNFLRVGLIKVILPKAKVIHCVRNPMDNCFSIFKNDFSRKGSNKYAYDMNELGRYYNLYQDLMAHWENVLPGFMFTICYEEMVADQRRQTESLLDFCGLPWDDACLSFHKTERRVETASLAQVRQPIYKDSVELWKRYEKRLAPLRKAIYGRKP
jgi:Flp pilus assembly protein TadD